MSTFDEIIQTKAYSDLNSSELEVVHELVSSEEEYNEMKSFYAGIGLLAISGREEVSASVKTSLNSVFQAKHPGINQNWNASTETEKPKIVPLYNRTIFRIAALVVLSAGIVTVWVSMSDNQLAKNEKEPMTASSDSVSQKQKEAAPKKEFPLNDQNQKEFTASSTIPADENVQQKVTVSSNATASGTYFLKDASSYDKSVSPVSSPETYKVSSTAANGSTTTYSFSSGRATKQKNWTEIQKEAGKKEDRMKAGLDADLNPGGFYAESVNDYKPSIKTSDLLTLIEPSF
ncbi:hypothetical protein [Fluviicola sp.]|uniref:hypothetical protein n=1 Tax=Fluviicola sp. TaxID=1917219 RepID=UPI0031D4B033